MRISDWSSDVCSSDLPFERNGKIRRQSRFPDPTLAAAHGDQAQLLLFRRHGDADVGHVLERFKLAPNSCFQHLALDLTQAGDIQDETHHSILQARSARAALACGLEQLFDFAKVGHGSALMEYGRKGPAFPRWAFLYWAHEKNLRRVGAERCTDE